MKKQMLVAGVYYAEKSGTYYVQGYFYDEKQNRWVGQYNSKTKSWGTHNIACTQDDFVSFGSKIKDGLIVEVEVVGYTASGYPTWGLV